MVIVMVMVMVMVVLASRKIRPGEVVLEEQALVCLSR